MAKRNGKDKPKAETAKEKLDRLQKRFKEVHPGEDAGANPPAPAADAKGNGKPPGKKGGDKPADDASGSSHDGKNGGGVDTKVYKIVVAERDRLKKEVEEKNKQVEKLTEKHLKLEADLDKLDNERKGLEGDLKDAKGDLKVHVELAKKYVKLGKEIGVEVDPTLPAKEKAAELAKKIKAAVAEQKAANERLRAQVGRRRKPAPDPHANNGNGSTEAAGSKLWSKVGKFLHDFWQVLTH